MISESWNPAVAWNIPPMLICAEAVRQLPVHSSSFHNCLGVFYVSSLKHMGPASFLSSFEGLHIQSPFSCQQTKVQCCARAKQASSLESLWWEILASNYQAQIPLAFSCPFIVPVNHPHPQHPHLINGPGITPLLLDLRINLTRKVPLYFTVQETQL